MEEGSITQPGTRLVARLMFKPQAKAIHARPTERFPMNGSLRAEASAPGETQINLGAFLGASISFAVKYTKYFQSNVATM